MNSIEWLTRLIAFDTTSRHSNLELIHTIEHYLQSLGITAHLTYNTERTKANLFATLPAHTQQTHDGIILSGHTDVVPVDGQVWESNPFQAVVTTDRVIGRGSCDMKGFIAVVLALLPEFCTLRLSKPLHLAFSYDEEVGCFGIPHLITDMQKQGYQPAACLVGEPTDMRPIIGHKGVNVFRCRMKGLAIHSSLTPRGCNAIEYAARFICWLRELANRLRTDGPLDTYYDIPFSTLTTNQIQGGNAVNTVPEDCEFMFEFRNLPTLNPTLLLDEMKSYLANELLPAMQSEYRDATIILEPVADVPGLQANEHADFTQLIQKLSSTTEIHKVAYGTEAGLFHQAGIDTLICGPGNIEQAHRPNEFVLIDQLHQCENFLRALVSGLT